MGDKQNISVLCYHVAMFKKIIKTILILATLALLAYATMWSYLIFKFMLVWQCQVYSGQLTDDAQVICDEWRSTKSVIRVIL